MRPAAKGGGRRRGESSAVASSPARPKRGKQDQIATASDAAPNMNGFDMLHAAVLLLESSEKPADPEEPSAHVTHRTLSRCAQATSDCS